MRLSFLVTRGCPFVDFSHTHAHGGDPLGRDRRSGITTLIGEVVTP